MAGARRLPQDAQHCVGFNLERRAGGAFQSRPFHRHNAIFPASFYLEWRVRHQEGLDHRLAVAETCPLQLAVDVAIQGSRQDGWKVNPIKMKRLRNAIKAVLEKAPGKGKSAGTYGVAEDVDAFATDSRTTKIFEIAKHQHEY